MAASRPGSPVPASSTGGTLGTAIHHSIQSVLAVPCELSGDDAGRDHGRTRDKAMNLIKSASSTRNVKHRDVAAAIVQSAGGGTPKTHFS